MRIGIDVDGVCSLFAPEVVSYLSTIKGYEHCTLETMDSTWSFYKGWKKAGEDVGMSTEEFLRHFRAGVDAGHIFSRAEPEEGAVEATHRLHEAGHTVHIVTDCSIGTHPGSAQRARAVWLSKWGFYFDSITFTPHKTDVYTDVFIDDKIENFIDLSTNGTKCYLVDRPWNQMNHPEWNDWYGSWGYVDTMRVKSIVEFADILTKEDVYA